MKSNRQFTRSARGSPPGESNASTGRGLRAPPQLNPDCRFHRQSILVCAAGYETPHGCERLFGTAAGARRLSAADCPQQGGTTLVRAAAPLLLSVNGGYVDTAGFLALQGLFAAHVTGNFVTAGAALVFGTSGVAAKLLASPVFGLVIALARILGEAMAEHPARRRDVLLTLQLVLLLTAGFLAIRLGPFANGNAVPAVLTGMVLVSGMAI